jgi:hypothetical protein
MQNIYSTSFRIRKVCPKLINSMKILAIRMEGVQNRAKRAGKKIKKD